MCKQLAADIIAHNLRGLQETTRPPKQRAFGFPFHTKSLLSVFRMIPQNSTRTKRKGAIEKTRKREYNHVREYANEQLLIVARAQGFVTDSGASFRGHKNAQISVTRLWPPSVSPFLRPYIT